MTATKTVAPANVKTAPKSAAKDAIALLKANHSAVARMFAEYKKTQSTSKKKVLVADLFAALSLQAQVEEEIFYPAVKAALKGKEPVPQAKFGRANVTDLIAQLEGVEPDDEGFDAKVEVLSECVERHFKEDQSAMFTKAKASSIDLIALGARMAARNNELLAQTA